MKKGFILALTFLLLICSVNFASATEGSGQPGLLYDFYYEWDNSWTLIPDSWTGSMVSLEYEENALLYNIEGKDPSVGFILEDFIELSEYPFIKIRVKNTGVTSEKFEMYIGRDDEPLSETNAFQYVIGKEHTEFKEFVIDAKTLKGAFWTGEMTTLRVDGLNNPEDGEQLFIEYLAFFKTKADADAWTPNRNQTPKPTAEPTPTPAPTKEPTQKPAATNTPAKTNKGNNTDTDSTDKGLNPIVLIICGVVVIAAVGAAILLIIRSKKNQQG